jgi:SlyX protein
MPAPFFLANGTPAHRITGRMPINLQSEPAVPPENDARLESLEMKLAYLEQASLELGDVVYRQQQELDALSARMQRLSERLEALMEEDPGPAQADEKPPHY